MWCNRPAFYSTFHNPSHRIRLRFYCKECGNFLKQRKEAKSLYPLPKGSINRCENEVYYENLFSDYIKSDIATHDRMLGPWPNESLERTVYGSGGIDDPNRGRSAEATFKPGSTCRGEGDRLSRRR